MHNAYFISFSETPIIFVLYPSVLLIISLFCWSSWMSICYFSTKCLTFQIILMKLLIFLAIHILARIHLKVKLEKLYIMNWGQILIHFLNTVEHWFQQANVTAQGHEVFVGNELPLQLYHQQMWFSWCGSHWFFSVYTQIMIHRYIKAYPTISKTGQVESYRYLNPDFQSCGWWWTDV
jgi:hypothetical protein